MPLKEIRDEDLKIFFSISEVARHLNVNPSLIRFWEKEFPQIKPRKNTRGERLYTKKDIQLLEEIYRLVKVEGFTLEGARRYLNHRRTAHAPAKDTLKPEESSGPLAPAASESFPPLEMEGLRERLLDAYRGILKIQNCLQDALGKLPDKTAKKTLFD
ncbi:MAG: MerR family transcriptional regulator [Flavobacteriales bacterium]|nr:MerR family transcriptional regulator [Flavobacteriales bacterium]